MLRVGQFRLVQTLLDLSFGHCWRLLTSSGRLVGHLRLGSCRICWLCWVIKWRIGQLLMDRAERDRESCLDNFNWSWRCLTFRLDIVEGSWPVRVDWLVIWDRDPAGLLTLLTEEVEDRSAVNGWNRKRPRKLVIRWGSWRFFEVGWVLLKAYGCCTALKSVGHPCSMILEQLLQKELCAISIAATKYGRWISTDSFFIGFRLFDLILWSVECRPLLSDPWRSSSTVEDPQPSGDLDVPSEGSDWNNLLTVSINN